MHVAVQAEINTWVVLSVALPGMTSDPTIQLPAAAVGGLLAIGTAGLTVSVTSHQSLLFSLVFLHAVRMWADVVSLFWLVKHAAKCLVSSPISSSLLTRQTQADPSDWLEGQLLRCLSYLRLLDRPLCALSGWQTLAAVSASAALSALYAQQSPTSAVAY